MKNFKKIALISLSIIILVAMSGCQKKATSSGEDWPSEPVTIITPWAVGGLADQVNRAMSEYGQEALGQPLLADNILGAGGAVALTEYLEEAPNSHNLIFGGEGSFAIAPLASEVEYSLEDYVPVINVYSSTFVLSSNPSVEVDSFEALEAYGAANTIQVAANGAANAEALQVAGLLDEMGIDFKIIPYEGANEALTAVVSGEVDFAVTHASLAKEFVKAGDVNPVVAFSDKKLVDEVYNLDSVGDHGYDTWITNICAVFMPAGTDEAVVKKAHDSLLEILENPDFLKTAENMGVNIDTMSGEEVNSYIKSVVEKAEKYSALVK